MYSKFTNFNALFANLEKYNVISYSYHIEVYLGQQSVRQLTFPISVKSNCKKPTDDIENSLRKAKRPS